LIRRRAGIFEKASGGGATKNGGVLGKKSERLEGELDRTAWNWIISFERKRGPPEAGVSM